MISLGRQGNYRRITKIASYFGIAVILSILGQPV